MYLVRSSNRAERYEAAEELEQRVPVGLIDNALVDINSVARPDFHLVLLQLLVPEVHGEPPIIEPFRIAHTLDDLVELGHISAELAHSTFSLIAPCVQLEFSFPDASTQLQIPVPRQSSEPLVLF
ncbi:MAG TPA: hypothetical protein VLG47_02925 [Candidatus Saccharimonadales bacterium]|nr:hypothetical protein [Candidatus Saccharimonadales bacterium]